MSDQPAIPSRLEIAKKLTGFLWERKLWWMIPMCLLLMMVGVLVVLAESSSLSPFIYTLF